MSTLTTTCALKKLLKIFCTLTTWAVEWIPNEAGQEWRQDCCFECLRKVRKLDDEVVSPIDEPKPSYVHLFAKYRFDTDGNQRDLLMSYIKASGYSHFSSNNPLSYSSKLWNKCDNVFFSGKSSVAALLGVPFPQSLSESSWKAHQL